MNPDSLPSPDAWLAEHQRLMLALIDHIRAYPSAAPQGAQPAAPEGYALVPCIGTVVKAKHPITCLNPTEFFEVTQVRAESDGKFAVRGEQTCWFGLNYLVSAASPADAAPVPQELERDAQRYRWLREKVTESPLRPASYGAAEFSDTRLRYEFPALVSWAEYCGRITLDEAIDAAMNAGLTIPAKEPKHG